MSQQEVVDIMNPQSGATRKRASPRANGHNRQKQRRRQGVLTSVIVYFQIVACSFPTISFFSTATFRYDNDFARWCYIGSCLPQVPLYIREVIFKPGVKSVLVDQVAAWPFVFHEREIIPNPPDIQLPDMPRVHKLVRKTSLHLSLPTACTPEARQFISKFRFLKEIEFMGKFSTVSDAKEFFGLLPPIEVLTIKGMDIHEAGLGSGQSPVFTGDMTNLHRLSFDECIISMDWLVDDILTVSRPANLQFICYKDSVPFSRKAFARLLTLSCESLQELIIQPPSD
ncbi:hypothetical protein IW262DRAFT_1459239 [Armillaria fumosa]|nr:hypothetical protein IW262DRAFT_1459239 [Armillaria fumosa]